MARKKGGLGQAAAVEEKEDLLDTVFGAAKLEQKSEPKSVRQPMSQKDTPPPAPTKDAEKSAGKGKDNRVGKYFLIDRDLAKSLKLYAVQNDMKEIAVIEASLRAFLGKSDE